MGGHRTIFVLIAIMTAVALVVGGVAIGVLYDTAFEQRRADLMQTAQSQARLIEAVARFDREFSKYDHPEGAVAATVSQVADAHERYEGFGGTGAFTLARREGDAIVFLLRHRREGLDRPRPVAFDSPLAEPTRRALAGESGTVVGLDYRGVTVLAAHEPVAVLNLGIVAKVDLAEVRAPFLRAGGIVLAIGFAIIAAGTALFFRVSNPMVRRIQKSEARLSTMLRNLTEGVVTIDESGIIESFNPAAERMFGYAAEETIGRSVKMLMPEPDRGKHGGYVRHYLETGEARIVGGTREVTGRRKDGTTFPLDLGVAEMHLGERRLFVGSLRDITERKAAEAERERLEAQLRQAQKMQAVGTLAGGIAHDFNNILAGMTGYAHLALDAVPAKSQVRGDLEQILKSIDRAASLVRQILAFSRRSDAERHPVEVGRAVEEALKLLRASIPATIEIRAEIDREAGTVIADATQLQQVAMNLCTNAADAIGPGPGTIEVALAGVELGDADTARRADLTPGSYAKLSVRDSGAGMDAATRARVFEPFFTTKEPGKGTGLGLAVAHGIVRDHGGTIEVDSAPGRGATFSVLLPRAGAVERGPARAQPDIPRGRERILLIDDEAAIVHSEARLLEWLGYRVEAATSSTRALAAFRAAPEAFDLIITDQAMPELSGMALAREILKVRGGIPIILCSGFSEVVGAQDAMAPGIREFITKPIHPGDLAMAVRRALDGDA